ncbi:MAG: pilus assembly protein [Thermomicrobiales bacterium]|nr:pilus assembly protein [Thermomicrobiales bacterium]
MKTPRDTVSVERPVARGRRSRRGQSLVEFCLGLPFMLLILLATIDMGQFFLTYIELRNAVREGASHAARNPCDDYTTVVDGAVVSMTVADFVRGHGPKVAENTDVEPLDFSPDVACDAIAYGTDYEVTVTAEHDFQPITTSFLNRFGMGPITLQASATAKVQT